MSKYDIIMDPISGKSVSVYDKLSKILLSKW